MTNNGLFEWKIDLVLLSRTDIMLQYSHGIAIVALLLYICVCCILVFKRLRFAWPCVKMDVEGRRPYNRQISLPIAWRTSSKRLRDLAALVVGWRLMTSTSSTSGGWNGKCMEGNAQKRN